ncbi:hypothetical protein QAD02_010069 [Eretmocerus hayati]|uniref:Uncharacterized protein n=1 Tax=Eretmocerus hayati TaxID=131215 RepID=A0ACC2NBF3_9HYME|nr:hypothetical protein QAD02_010069 [Eretmocerus hayati]
MDFDPVFSADEGLSTHTLEAYVDLLRAVRSRDEIRIQKLLDEDTPVNHYLSSPYNHTPLHLAVQSRSLEIARILLDKGADMNAKNVSGETPLILAAKTENTSLVDLLLSYDVSNQEDNDHFSHLHIACMRNRVDIVKKLLSMNQGQDLNKPVKHSLFFCQGYTPLHFSVRYGCQETVEYLLKCGADITAKDSMSAMTPLHLADLQRDEQILDLLLTANKSAFKNPDSVQGVTHFHIACTRDDPSVVEYFLNLGVDINLKVSESHGGSWKGWTPIHFALYYECPKVIDLLLRSGVELQSTTFSKMLKYKFMMGCDYIYNKRMIPTCNTPATEHKRLSKFYSICSPNHVWSIARSITDLGINVPSDFNELVGNGGTFLHMSVEYKSISSTKYLLKHGADVMIQNGNGETPLHIAFYRDYKEIFMLIVNSLDDNAQNNVVDNDGLSIFHILCTTNKIQLLQSILESGVDVNAQVMDGSEFWAGFSPMHFACMYLQPEVVKFLLENHADIGITNQASLNPFDFVIGRMALDLPRNHEKYFRVLEKILLFLSSEADSTFNTRGVTILHALCCLTDEKSMNLLQQCIKACQDKVNSSIQLDRKHPYNGCTPFHLAMEFGNIKKAELMLDNGANPLIENSAGKTGFECAFLKKIPLHTLGRHAKSLFSFKIVNQTPIRPSHFYMACCVGPFRTVKHVLKVSDKKTKKILVNCRDDCRRSSLHSLLLRENPLIKAEKIQRIELLLENRTAANARDYEWRTPLHYAHSLYDIDFVKLLVRYGSNANTEDIYGNIPFFLFAESNSEDCLTFLLNTGADINKMDRKGRTCLTKKFPIALNALSTMTHRIYNENERKCITVMLKHIKKLQLIGWHVSEENKRAYELVKSYSNVVFEEAAFEYECRKELESMIIVRVDPYTTLRDILFKSLNRMTYHCENEDLIKIILSDGFYEKYPLYGGLVEVHCYKGVWRQDLLSNVKKSLNFLNELPLPQMCLEMILAFLSDADLREIIAKAKKS